MLIDNPKLKNVLINAHKEPCYQQVGNSNLPAYVKTRFYFTVDSNDTLLSAGRTNQYSLIQNRDFLNAIDIAASELDMELNPHMSAYRNGQSRIKLTVPNFTMQPTGDPSPAKGLLELTNDYRGLGGLGINFGWLRTWCSNGATYTKIGQKSTKRHIGNIELYEWVYELLQKYNKKYEVETIVAETLAGTPLHFTSPKVWHNLGDPEAAKEALKRGISNLEIVDRLLAETSKRYHKDLWETANNYQREIGNSMWALAQSVTDLATHRMQQTAKGEGRAQYNMAADQWATKMLQHIVAATEDTLDTPVR